MGSIKKSRAHDLRQTGVMLLLESFWKYPGAWGKVGIETLPMYLRTMRGIALFHGDAVEMGLATSEN